MIRFETALKTILAGVFAAFCSIAAADAPAYRPPAVPLVVHNPLFSIWSCADSLTDDVTRHWTKHPNSLNSIIRIDGQSYHLMGVEPRNVTSLPQMSVRVLPTRTIYEFQGQAVHVTLTFLTPALPNDIDVLSRPLTYLTWEVKSTDGKPHDVSLLFSASGELAVDNPKQSVVWQRPGITGLTALKMGSRDQAYVQRNGDDARIDWGYAYIAAAADQSKGAIGSEKDLLNAFCTTGTLPAEDDANQPRAVADNLPTMALAIDCGKVSAKPVSRRAMIAYDDIYHVDFFGSKLPAYWRRTPGMDGDKLLSIADKEYDSLLKRCVAFDDQLMADITRVGGKDYAYMCALAYRQSLGACGIAADSHGQPLLFTKENTSNGNMATVDVIFPMDPILVFLSPALAKASLAPVFVYAASPRWKWPNAPHDLGEYPVAFGRDDGGESMPVEESGNMIILADAVCQEEGNTKFVDQWWPQLMQWAKYLEKYGLDPEEQLCTDDFKGRLAHNANLSVKAIVALAAYGDMARMHGDAAAAKKYSLMAHADAKHWVDADSEGDHFKLAFNKPNTWGQNYNMVWDRILNLNVFPPEVSKKQIEFYKKHLKAYGLPLDSRDQLTKTDWTIWTASLADNQADFETLVNPIIGYLNSTSARSPFVDSYVTDDIHSDGMHARPVIGGVFARMLTDKGMWKKWAGMDKKVTGGWATLPKPPIVTEVVLTSRKSPQTWAYAISKPADDWMKPDFDDSAWAKGPGGFGRGSPGSNPHTDWSNDDIWIRRGFDLPDGDRSKLQFLAYHDEDMEIYINGVLAGSASDYNSSYQLFDITREGQAALKTGHNTMAVHCHQTTGGQFIDVGIVTAVPDDGQHASAQWPPEKAWAWYKAQPWLCGFNYVPSNCISYTEMWMGDHFDPALIDREFAVAEKVGLNCTRVVLPYVVWEAEPEAFKGRMTQLLEIAHRHGIAVMFAFFDDCVFGPIIDPVFGKQPDVVDGWYANGWTPSPGHTMVKDPSAHPKLKKYVQDILTQFKSDPRVWVWDLYNEPTNGGSGDHSIPLLLEVFDWAREVNPSQPVTVGEFSGEIYKLIGNQVDIVSFHNYDPADSLSNEIAQMKKWDRPVICTEWMNRNRGSTAQECLPIFQAERVGCLCWGLVNGRTQTNLNWGHKPGEPLPKFWQHDLFKSDLTPYDPSEIELFHQALDINRTAK